MVRVGTLFPAVIGQNASDPGRCVNSEPGSDPPADRDSEGGLRSIMLAASNASDKTPRRTTADDIYSRHLMCRSILGHRRQDDGSLAAADVDALELLLRGDI